MEKVFSYLEDNYRYLNNFIRDFDEALFSNPHSAIIKGRTFTEQLAKETAKLEKHESLISITQFDRLTRLKNYGILQNEIYGLFDTVRILGNKAAHDNVEGELETALRIHKNLYKITCWFVKSYIKHDFQAEQYKNPMPLQNKPSVVTEEMFATLMEKMDSIAAATTQKNQNVISDTSRNQNVKPTDDNLLDLFVESIVDTKESNKKCMVQELSRLKESSKEAVEGISKFTPFKKYMHVDREAQKDLKELIFKASEAKTAQLILVCGSVGDGKSHIISFFNNEYPDIMNNFYIHNDATESLEPNKTSMDTLNDVLDCFCDEKIDQCTQKSILAINLGTLNNFIDSKYGDRFTILRDFVQNKKILEASIENSDFDVSKSFQFVNFSDYHIFTLKDGRANSDYIKSLINKIAGSSNGDFFQVEYKNYCSKCDNCNCCPIKANYELLGNERVQEAIIDLLVQCIIKNKIIISTRALLNFIYELIVPITHIDVNSPTFKKQISNMNSRDYIKSLMPNIIFDHKELSFIFEALNSLDPLNVRNQKVDDFIIEFKNAADMLCYFDKYIDYPKGYIDKISQIDINETEDRKIRYDLLKLFIRSYYICGKGDIFPLKDVTYENYMTGLFNWNKGDKSKLRGLYDDVKNGILKWNGEADKDYINIFIGKNQIRYKLSESLVLKADTSNLKNDNNNDIKKFISTLKLKYKSENAEKSYEIDVDFSLYKLLMQVGNGYRPNKKDKNHFIKFIEFINKLEENGSQNEKLVFVEKNKELSNKYKLEYDTEFKVYRFVEI